jgi:hypothetical protein
MRGEWRWSAIQQQRLQHRQNMRLVEEVNGHGWFDALSHGRWRRRRSRRLGRTRGRRRLRAEEWKQRFVSAQTGYVVEQCI